MSNFEILKSPWEKDFVRLLSGVQRHVRLASPFIKTDVASIIAENIRPGARIDFLNSFKLANLHRVASDLEALGLFYITTPVSGTTIGCTRRYSFSTINEL